MLNTKIVLFTTGYHLIFMFILAFALLIVSKLLNLKRKHFAPAYVIAVIYTFVSLLFYFIQFVSAKLSPQIRAILFLGRWIVLITVLILLIKSVYNIGWKKAFVSWLILFGIYVIFVTLLMGVVFAFFGEDISRAFRDIEKRKTYAESKMILSDFEIGEIGKKVGASMFVVKREDVITEKGVKAVNLHSSIKFPAQTKNVYLNMDCWLPHALLFGSLSDEIIRYSFDSIKYTSDFKVHGNVQMQCVESCSKNKAVMNSGHFTGTKLVTTDKDTGAEISIGFAFEGTDSVNMNCNFYVIAEEPAQSIKKSFNIKYVGS